MSARILLRSTSGPVVSRIRALWHATPINASIQRSPAGIHRCHFATATRVPPSEQGNISSKAIQDEKFHQLKQVVETPLLRLQDQLKSNTVTYPLNLINEESDSFKHSLMIKFRENINRQLESFTYDKSKMTPISRITLVDFINPKIEHITQLIYLINAGKYPKNFLEFNKLETKQDLLLQIFGQLLYQEYYVQKIETTPFEEKEIDFSNPAQWFPLARKMKRKLIMHVGPTNSGKTHHSLLKLSQAKTGYYAGPLRLLGREIFERFNKQGIACNLVTGEEVIPRLDRHGKISGLTSGTIEMIPLHKKMDLCVIDEIQMIGNDDRGAAWTNAVLGVLADEIHLCGEESAIPIIKHLVKLTGDELHIKRFERLGKLTVEDEHATLDSLKKGDCVVAFSRRKLLDLKQMIERTTNFKVSIIYGALPPQIRSQQAELFNNGSHDILVATDAVGMGLNLKIKRIVFSNIVKFGSRLTNSEARQIGGRAGRYSAKEAFPEGFVTALDSKDLAFIKKCFEAGPGKIQKAGIWPPAHIWQYYMVNTNPELSITASLKEFTKKIPKLDHFFICDGSMIENARLLKDDLLAKMSIHDQYTLSRIPLRKDDEAEDVREFIDAIASAKTKTVFDFSFLDLKVLSQISIRSTSIDQISATLEKLESMHSLVITLKWLAHRFPDIFVDRESLHDIKSLIEKRIAEELDTTSRWNKLGWTNFRRGQKTV
ncbi:uncharacterized protein J8A68_005977 [[Candida] subhashii]|uniref:RNA helicase n=1 Tax=[Candida] subhashii TaxID=561895 RepID=A0A8J5UDS3_9ASCO|nr:uncharacterized protein J8A68_005977 [[Candida] subhashii]KAG7660558.1 hypothetical protein J8A68_005977 [[Candida] subhashii]